MSTSVKRLFLTVLGLFFLTTSIQSFELKNYLLNRDAQKFVSSKKMQQADSVLSVIETEKYNDIVSYNKGVVHLNKGEFTTANKYFEHALKGNNIHDDVIKYNMYKAIKDSGVAQLQKQADGKKTLEAALLKMKGLYSAGKDSTIRTQALHELYEISEILDQANKNKQQKKDDKDKDKDKDKEENKDQENKDKEENKDPNKDKDGEDKKKPKPEQKSDEEKSHKILLDNVKEDRKNKVKDEIKAIMKQNKSDQEW